MSRLRGLLGRDSDTSDVESEREALRRQRLDAAAEIEALKAALADRVAHVQEREQELEQTLARVTKREEWLKMAAGRGARLDSVRARLAEARVARASRTDDKEQASVAALRSELAAIRTTLLERELELAALAERSAVQAAALEASGQAPAPESPPQDFGAAAKTLAAREAELDARAAELDAREAELTESSRRSEDEATAVALHEERELMLAARESALKETEAAQARRAAELTTQESALAAREAALPTPERGLVAGEKQEEAARPDARLEELRAAEQAFVKTRAELAALSDALAEQESQLTARERALAGQEAPPAPDLGALEARIRRLEHRASPAHAQTQTFSAGLRALQERGLRAPAGDRKEPLH